MTCYTCWASRHSSRRVPHEVGGEGQVVKFIAFLDGKPFHAAPLKDMKGRHQPMACPQGRHHRQGCPRRLFPNRRGPAGISRGARTSRWPLSIAHRALCPALRSSHSSGLREARRFAFSACHFIFLRRFGRVHVGLCRSSILQETREIPRVAPSYRQRLPGCGPPSLRRSRVLGLLRPAHCRWPTPEQLHELGKGQLVLAIGREDVPHCGWIP